MRDLVKEMERKLLREKESETVKYTSQVVRYRDHEFNCIKGIECLRESAALKRQFKEILAENPCESHPVRVQKIIRSGRVFVVRLTDKWLVETRREDPVVYKKTKR